MTAFTVSRTAVLLISGGPYRRFVVHFSRRSQDVSALTPPLILRHSAGFPNGRKARRRGRGGGVWAEEELSGNHDLEAEIYEFMQRSANPMDFPSRDDLVSAGREDLAMAIVKEGGWLAYGWDLDEEEEEGTASTVSGLAGKRQCEDYSRTFQHRTTLVAGDADASLKTDLDSLCACSEESSASSTSGRPMDTEVPQDAGIEGILSRLEKERSFTFGFVSSRENEVMVKKEESLSIMDVRHGFGNVVRSIESTGICVSSSLGEGSHHHPSVQDSNHGSLMDTDINSDPGKWRSWSILRSGDPLADFEAAEIVLEEDQRKSNINSVGRLASRASSGNNCPYDNGQDQDKESLLKQLHDLSDALEFQQNEIKNARDILRSTRAKLAVMEGKIALGAIESHKVIEVKQMRLAAAECSLRILRSVCIVWPNSASEVLLAGSFDGWTSQWRMEKNNSRVFSLCLKLYPGRYEIKFIVDGVWVVDPLRPIANTNNNGFENNLLLVT